MDSRRADPEREEVPRKKHLSQKGGLTAGEDLGQEDSPQEGLNVGKRDLCQEEVLNLGEDLWGRTHPEEDSLQEQRT